MSAIDQMQLIKLSLSISARGQRSYKKAHYQEYVSTFSGHITWTVFQVLNIDTQSELKRHQDPTQKPQLVGPQASKPLTSPNNSKETRCYLAKVKVTEKYVFPIGILAQELETLAVILHNCLALQYNLAKPFYQP